MDLSKIKRTLLLLIICVALMAGYRISTAEAPLEPERTLDEWISFYADVYDQDEALAREIMRCEASMYGGAINHNRRADGSIWSTDTGLWQINDYYHEDRAKSMGLDIWDDVDNIRYGFILLKEQGVQPWSASEHCWR